MVEGLHTCRQEGGGGGIINLENNEELLKTKFWLDCESMIIKVWILTIANLSFKDMNLTNYKVALSPLFFFLPLKNLMNYKSSL
jgi:hypothetical protein